MKILCLYNNTCALELFEWVRKQGHGAVFCTEKIGAEWCRNQKIDLAVSYTYRYILPQKVLDALGNNAVNLHNSFLPWNRGADPNIWSIIDGTPRGVTLHYMDAGLDSGDIIAQAVVPYKREDTLETSYGRLDLEAKKLFKDAFRYYPFWRAMGKKAEGKGTYHSKKDGASIRGIIDTYNVNVEEFRTKALELVRGVFPAVTNLVFSLLVKGCVRHEP